ncbi:GNAT family N-acetyltransferase [Pseudoalteromonas luteoviolacea]|uniref:N-acetyltransferase domain-containing protein n=1 Tax=Pseudoalteromonas luteoviolacea S4054 TaxID=1129367 RepID=A0A0F6A410_9GAMM|nr:GNAT family N-acetyltransferase [Pseudoalteromonas luteoviolacea]AOT10394.1 GCN5 family acetyltransferase [Pseudoalteromonas luteoviolacea]AOT15536.1 GCN5 family acetyltransferase [Pseudoalteromonas luteoviolacea]AOT20213.1 GCN5 family acetyltransferase [Pseudoalteromonas luteoviolacea]KKE80947.1 hypothetical protein N479_24110 [Pseudoalteromonas luteoviolacea S4054]KZN64688.1 hypothetical protein N481_25375 [Pseudoalteromonas luteoviolacea S4047-1]
MLQTRINTDRLTLKVMTEKDAAGLFNIFSDPKVMKYWNTDAWSSIEQALLFISSSADNMETESALTLGVYSKENELLLGKVMLFNYDKESRRAELGFGISSDFWGKGIVFEAASAVIDFAFSDLRIRRLEAEIDPDNIASARALERLGFEKEGLLRERWEINGIISDSALYGLLAQKT